MHRRAEPETGHWHWVVLHHGDFHTVCRRELARDLFLRAPEPRAVAKVPPGLSVCPLQTWADLLGSDFVDDI